MKRIVVLALVGLPLVGCSKNKKTEPSISVPQFEGLSLIHPKIKASAISNLENSVGVSVGSDEASDAQLKTPAVIEKAIQSLGVEQGKLRAEVEGLRREEKDQRELIKKLQAEDKVVSYPAHLLNIAKSKPDSLSAEQLKLVKNEERLEPKYYRAKDEVDDLQFQINDLGFIDTYILNTKKELQSKLAEKQKSFEAIKAERGKNFRDIEVEEAKINEQIRKEAHARGENINKAQRRLAEIDGEIQLKFKKISELDQRLSSLRQKLVGLKKSLASSSERRHLSELERKLVEKKLALALQLRDGQTPALADVVEAFILQNEVAYKAAKSSNKSLQESLVEIAGQVQEGPIEKFKVSYEDIVASKYHQGQSLIYNKSAITMSHPINDNRMQCYSGTSMFLTLNELSKTPHNNKVVVFTEGHVLPGFVKAKDNRLNLYGIETTADGVGLTNFGATAEIEGAIRVFDSHQFMLVELFKQDIENFDDVYKEMLDTSARYGLRTEKFEGQRVSAMGGTRSDAQTLNSSPLGFGYARVADGDIKREKSDYEENMLFRPRPSSSAPEGGVPMMRAEETPPCRELDNRSRFGFCRDRDGRIVRLSDYLAKSRGRFDVTIFKKDGSVKEVKRLMDDDARVMICEKSQIYEEDYSNNKGLIVRIEPKPTEGREGRRSPIFYGILAKKRQGDRGGDSKYDSTFMVSQLSINIFNYTDGWGKRSMLPCESANFSLEDGHLGFIGQCFNQPYLSGDYSEYFRAPDPSIAKISLEIVCPTVGESERQAPYFVSPKYGGNR